MIKKSFFSLLITLLAVTQLMGQQLDGDLEITNVMDVPPARRICKLTPTDVNAHFYVQVSPEIQARMKQKAKTNTTFDVDYFSQCNGEEWPEAAKNALEYTLAIWADHIESDVPIKIDANWTSLKISTLGSARPTKIVQVANVGEPNTWYTLAELSALTGQAVRQQLNNVDYDIDVNIQCSFDDWYFGTDANTPDGKTDFVTVVLHEIGHGIGFLGSMVADTDAETAEWGIPDDNRQPLIYDHFAVDGDHNNLIDETVYPNPSSSELYSALVGERGGIYFDGFTANNSLIGQEADRAKLYSPNPFREGSSYSHVDLQTFRHTINGLMVPFLDRAFAIHSPGPLLCGMLSDMGWPLGPGCLHLISIVNQTSVDFGVINVGQTSEFNLVISHPGITEEPLVGTLELDDGNFSIVGSNQFSIDPGMSQEITLQYTPQSVGVHETTLSLSHNAENVVSPLLIKLKGEALKAGQVLSLYQSYPNPFTEENQLNVSNPVIRYSISEDTDVKLDLYTISGQHVQTLVDARKEAGVYEASPDMNGLSSGVYIYRILADGITKSRKLLYLK